jgi:hypothetical protein
MQAGWAFLSMIEAAGSEKRYSITGLSLFSWSKRWFQKTTVPIYSRY